MRQALLLTAMPATTQT